MMSTYKFMTVLVHSAVDSSIRPPAYFLQDSILVDDQVGLTVGIVAGIFGSCIEGFLAARNRSISGSVHE